MVNKFMEKADVNQVDAMAERALRNEVVQEKETLLREKEILAKGKEDMIFHQNLELRKFLNQQIYTRTLHK